ncbi:hypothetical protein PVAND_011512 [Polypedilum vanderplanki]|uniref:Eukaryotic translation initiation factor 4 gamma n=1 Tax=Polypedilum vanderplanki TaxID=319348 RepID=A0A9J6CIU4_POLVA|nr:hypothetical protein PVAND_011512 [Polypedilum vanderplanki]
MDQSSSEELSHTFEIIDKKELLMTSTENDSDSLNNNNNINTDCDTNINDQMTTTIIAADKISEKNTDDDNGNNNTDNSNSKKYTRDQLIQMKQIASTMLPDLKREVKNLIFTETSALDNTLNRKIRADAVIPNFMPLPGRNSAQRPKSEYAGNRKSQQGNKGQIITMRLTSNEEVKLNEAKNAWKPSTLAQEEVVLSEEEKKTEELKKQFRGILNKLSPDNFLTLVGKLKTLQIDTVDRLDECISLVFEKAITEPNYAPSYALLCKEVSDVFIVPLDPTNAQQQNAVFKKRLITQCQREFEKHRDNELIKNTAERLKKIEAEEDPVKREELKNDFEYESMKVRKRAVGTVHFIGELYKIEMLTSKIMRSCITHLLDPSMCSEETLECLCKLLETIGKRLEKTDKNRIDLTDYFQTLEKLADKKNPSGISARIRFMIQDVIELRMNNWTPRKPRQGNKPLTMDEIKQQVIMEQAIKEMDNREAFREQGNRQNTRRTGAVNEEGWSMSYSKSRPVKFDPLKLPTNASEDIKLGQPSNFQNFSNFQSNRFAGLKEEDQMEQANRNYNGRFSGGASSNMNSPNRNSFENRNNRNNRGGNRSAGSKSLQSPQLQKYGTSRNSNNMERHRNPSMQFHMQRPNDLPVKASLPTRKISAPARPMQYSEAFIQERNLINDPNKVFNIMKSSLTGYQHNEITLDEIMENLKKFRISKDSLVLLYNWAFDQHDNERLQLTEIICEGVSGNIITTKDLLDALKETIELAQDLACDLPLVYNYIGQFLALPLTKRIISLKDLYDISKSQIDEFSNGEVILKNVFKIIDARHGKDALSQLYCEANTNLQLFLDTANTQLSEFLKENNFDYLMQMQENNSMDNFDKELKDQLEQKLKSESDVEAIIIWITENIKEHDNKFIRVLMELLLKNCIEKMHDGSYRLERERLDFFAPLLTQFVEKSKEKQIQCLQVIHRYMNELEHPQSCLNDILTCLYENFALSKSAFFKWHDDDDPHEQEGKGVALKSIHPFIQFLKTEKDENDDDSTGDEN